MHTRDFTDQHCRCGAKVTAKELSKGAAPFRENIIIGYLDHVTRAVLCVPCQATLSLLLEGNIRRIVEITGNHPAAKES